MKKDMKTTVKLNAFLFDTAERFDSFISELNFWQNNEDADFPDIDEFTDLFNACFIRHSVFDGATLLSQPDQPFALEEVMPLWRYSTPFTSDHYNFVMILDIVTTATE